MNLFTTLNQTLTQTLEQTLGLIPEGTRAAGLSVLMKGAGKVTRFLPIPQPTLLVGPGASRRLGQAIASFGHEKLLVVTDAVIVKLGLLDGLTRALDAGGAAWALFDEITPDAPIPLIERGLARFQEEGCDALVAVGGGSAMDAAKAIAIASANPHKGLRSLAGYFKGLNPPPPVYAVPTTAGTGSEVTVAAVVADPQRRSKLVIVDTRLVPKMAALDPELMTGLPPAITAATGMDALTHAVEAYLGHWATPGTDGLALAAVGMIFDNLRRACREGQDLEVRERMSLAATYAGMAFTRANVGYVHAIAHQFGGRYHTPHGLANAIVLPQVLRFLAPEVTNRLATLALRARLGTADEDEATLAGRFLDGVEALNRDLGIPTHLAALREKDIPALAEAALHEAHTGYPVPRYMSRAECEALIRRLLPPAPASVAAAALAPAAVETDDSDGNGDATVAPAAPRRQRAAASKTPRAPRKPRARKTVAADAAEGPQQETSA